MELQPLKLLPAPQQPVALLPAITLTSREALAEFDGEFIDKDSDVWLMFPVGTIKAYLGGWIDPPEWRQSRTGLGLVGPYSYLRWRENGRKRSHYLGKVAA